MFDYSVFDEYGLELLVEAQYRPIGGFDTGNGTIIIPFSEDELTTLYQGVRNGATNFFTILSRGGYTRKTDEENWLRNTPCTFEEIEAQAAWYALRRIGLSDPKIAQLDHEERQLRFRVALEKNPKQYAFSNQRRIAKVLLDLAAQEDLRA